MKLILEELKTIDGSKTFTKIKEIKDKKEAVKGQFIHTCYHDEEHPKSCKRELVK